MCGISGVKGRNAIVKALLITVGQLERGDLSSGIAWIRNGKLKYYKIADSPVKLLYKVISNPHMYNQTLSDMAIAHNRFPSIGQVTVQNAHPFISCDKSFALVHNGTSSTINSLRKELKERHKIFGETDSELLTHLLEEYIYEHGDMITALEKLYEKYLNGAIIVLTRNREIYAIRNSSAPIHYCEYNGEIYIASTENAIRNITSKKAQIIKLKPRQILRATDKGIEVIGEGEEEKDIYKWITEYDYDFYKWYRDIIRKY